MKTIFSFLFSLSLSLHVHAQVMEQPVPLLFQNPDGRSPESFVAEGQMGMVASASPLASKVGLDLLKQGGNAVDAAVAVSFMISVIRPQSTGIGGGGFMLSFQAATKEVEVFDCRERAPARAHRDMYIRDGQADSDLSLNGHLAVAVPGLVAGLVQLHAEQGTLPFAAVINPAINTARNGFPVYPELARRLLGRAEVIQRNPAMKAVFFPGGEAVKEGDLLIQRDLAGTLEQIRDQGAAGFYQGEVATKIVKDMVANDGWITDADLAAYSVKKHSPIHGHFRGLDIYSMPPPSSGGVHLVQMLNVLSGYDLEAMIPGSAEYLHILIEAMRSAYADRAHFLGDPDFVSVPVEWLTSQPYAETIRSSIPKNRARTSADVGHGTYPSSESPSTTHLSVIDGQGNVVSSTQTINYSFGACVMAEGTGVVLNNEMDDFSINPGTPNVYGLVGGEANAIAPGKTPLSSMSPTIVLKDGKPLMVVGSPGGPRIITAVMQTVLNRVVFEMDLFDAVAAGRIHHQWLPDIVYVEKGYVSAEVIAELRRMGHTIQEQDAGFGDIQAVLRNGADGKLQGVSDPRVAGQPAGY